MFSFINLLYTKGVCLFSYLSTNVSNVTDTDAHVKYTARMPSVCTVHRRFIRTQNKTTSLSLIGREKEKSRNKVQEVQLAGRHGTGPFVFHVFEVTRHKSNNK